jgi:hypothetical protein
MILRKLAEAIRKQNWFTVVLEILIVVIGIFLGLQANDWNQARQDRALELHYLARLQADLGNDLERLDESDYYARLRTRQVSRLLDAVADPQAAAADPNRFIESVEKASWEAYRRMTSHTYAEMLGANGATLVRSESLRYALAEYYAEVEFWETVLKEESLAREYAVATAGLLSAELLDVIVPSGPSPEPIELGAYTGRAVEIAEALNARTQAVRLLPVMYKHHQTVLVANAEIRRLNEALRVAIEEYVRREYGPG